MSTPRRRALTSTGLITLSILLLSSTVARAGVKHAYTGQRITEAAPGTALERPWGLAFDSGGSLYVTDTRQGVGHSLVDVYNSTNEFAAQFGSSLLDSKGRARSVAVDTATGAVYVADSEESTVLVFKPDGKGGYEHVTTWTGASTKLDGSRFHGWLHVAVDNSTGPHRHDVYVLGDRDVFEEEGVVVAFRPDLLGDEGEVVDENSGPAGGFQLPKSGRNQGIAVQALPGDNSGDVYVSDTRTVSVETFNVVDVFNAAGVEQPSLAPQGGSLTEGFLIGRGTSVALDSATGELYVADSAHDVIDEYAPGGEFLGSILGTCPSAGVCPPDEALPFGEVLAVAIDPLNGRVYVSDGADNAVDIFGPDILPEPPVIASQASLSVTQRTAIMQATINPRESNTTYRFEWGPSTTYGTTVPVPDAGIGAGVSDVNVGQQLAGLQPGTTYHFRVVATNSGGTTDGSDATFITRLPVPPSVATGVAETVTQNAASITGSVDPHGFHTTYEFDLGADTSYGTRVFGDAGSGISLQLLATSLQGLAPASTYHYRLQATNTFGTSYGVDETFTTPSFESAPLTAPLTAALLAVPPVAFPLEPPPGGPASHPLTNQQKLTAALKACRRRLRRQRASCEKEVRRRYHTAGRAGRR
jgi:DNA-binding beta-propeller fold protein YncE